MDWEGRTRRRRNPWQLGKHAWLFSNLLPGALRGEPLSPAFSTNGSLFSASAVSCCGATLHSTFNSFAPRMHRSRRHVRYIGLNSTKRLQTIERTAHSEFRKKQQQKNNLKQSWLPAFWEEKNLKTHKSKKTYCLTVCVFLISILNESTGFAVCHLCGCFLGLPDFTGLHTYF